MSKKSKSTRKAAKKESRNIPVAAIVIVILLVSNAATLYYFFFIDKSVPISDVPMGIADVASASDEYIGKTVTLIGYLVIAGGNHLLVSNPMFYFNNSLDASNHVIISGNIPESISNSLGREIAVTGLLETEDDDGTLGTVFDSYYDLTTEVSYPGIYVDARMDPYPLFNLTPTIMDPTPEKYAVLYSGGITVSRAYSRYWNDIIYMYFILQMYGYESENIYVVYKDGVSEDNITPVDYPATHESLDTVFGILSDEMGESDSLFFYTTNHGGTLGISVWQAMDEHPFLRTDQIASWLDSITCRDMIIVMQQCHSGDFIRYLSAENRVIMTACESYQSSYACDTEGNWDEFSYHFMCAVTGVAWNGDDVTINADFNDNGYVSMREAFIWAALMDSWHERPLYNDNGDGDGYNVLEVAFGDGPWPGEEFYLNVPPYS